jgi:hypothetical protein
MCCTYPFLVCRRPAGLVSGRLGVVVDGFPLDQFAAFKAGASADECDEVWCVDGPPVGLGVI